MTSTSPLRYPGGKARFTNFLWDSILESGEDPNLFVEPFCGGAAAIALLESEKVNQIALNDLDPLVSSFWKVVFGKSRKSRHDINWLIRKIETSQITIEEWKRQKSIKPNSLRSAAWKCLFLNRTSFNGIIHKSGPIGGWKQNNRKLDVRFNRDHLIKRIEELYEFRDQVVRVDSVNWKLFCSYFNRSPGVYLYLDPPYYHRAEQLYGYLFDQMAHKEMRDYLIKKSSPWILSYDDAPEIRALYTRIRGINGRVIDQTYSTHPIGGASFIGRELFFSNRKLPMPKKSKIHVGITVVGCVGKIDSVSDGPTRIPLLQLLA